MKRLPAPVNCLKCGPKRTEAATHMSTDSDIERLETRVRTLEALVRALLSEMRWNTYTEGVVRSAVRKAEELGFQLED